MFQGYKFVWQAVSGKLGNCLPAKSLLGLPALATIDDSLLVKDAARAKHLQYFLTH
jgi:hypothetical protein